MKILPESDLRPSYCMAFFRRKKAIQELDEAKQTLCIVEGKDHVSLPRTKKIKTDDQDFFEEQLPEGLRKRRKCETGVARKAILLYLSRLRNYRIAFEEYNNAWEEEDKRRDIQL